MQSVHCGVDLLLLGDGFVSGKFPSVVRGNGAGVHLVAVQLEQVSHGMAYDFCGLALNATDNSPAGSTLEVPTFHPCTINITLSNTTLTRYPALNRLPIDHEAHPESD